MSAVAFDTYAAVKTLREAGADEAMAEAIVNTASAAVGAGHDEFATKADIADMKADIAEFRASTKADIAELRVSTKADLDAAIASVRTELGTIRWTVGLIAAFLFAIGLRVFGLI